MLKLRVVQAACGDCLILELGTPAQPKYVLIDGGPEMTYDNHLRFELSAIGGQIAIAVLSHVDNDHVLGLLDLMADLRQQETLPHKSVTIAKLWHNCFSQTIGAGNNIAAQLAVVMASAGATSKSVASGTAVVQAIGEGDRLRRDALLLKIPINPDFTGNVVTVDNTAAEYRIDAAIIRVVGPSQAILEKLKKQWQAWLTKYADHIASGNPALAAAADQRIPNLSSIVLYVKEGDKSMLLTGDARGDHIIQGLRQAKALDAGGALHVNLLKLPHHSSSANVTPTFFKKITADTYVISADQSNDNPDLETLMWLLDAAKSQGRHVDIVLTNETPESLKIPARFPAQTYDYGLSIMPKAAHSQVIDVSAG